MNDIFLDTVGLLALWDRSDQWHDAAEDAFTQLSATTPRLVTTTYVLLECGNATARRPYRQQLIVLRDLLSARGDLIEPTEEDVRFAWETFGRGNALCAGIVDETSFAVMRRLDIRQAFTNDEHFRRAGFHTLF